MWPNSYYPGSYNPSSYWPKVGGVKVGGGKQYAGRRHFVQYYLAMEAERMRSRRKALKEPAKRSLREEAMKNYVETYVNRRAAEAATYAVVLSEV